MERTPQPADIGKGATPMVRTLPNAGHPMPTSGAPSPNPWSAAYPDPRLRGRAPSHFVFGKASRFNWMGSGNLSIKTVYCGHAVVGSDGGLHRIERGSYLVLNQGKEYELTIDSAQPVEGLSVYFDEQFVSDAYRCRRTSMEHQLDGRKAAVYGQPEYFERIFSDDRVQIQLDQIHEELPSMHRDPLWVQENLHLTLNLLIDRQNEIWNEVEEVQAVRAVTKEELYRRLYKARDYAYATIDQPVSLDDLAYVACLSTNYFLRSFRGLFKQTPHQFIIEKRMERAQKLLSQTDLSVSEICLAVGFQSLGSFSWLFKRRVGASPEAFRRQSWHPNPSM